MDDQNGRDSEHDEQDEVARARALILSRRRTLMAAAMTGLSVVGACSSSKSSVCLSIALPDSGTHEDRDAAPSVCLSIQRDAAIRDDASVRRDAGPTVCLSPPWNPMDAGGDGGPQDAGSDAGPDAGNDAGPSVCLSVPYVVEKGRS